MPVGVIAELIRGDVFYWGQLMAGRAARLDPGGDHLFVLRRALRRRPDLGLGQGVIACRSRCPVRRPERAGTTTCLAPSAGVRPTQRVGWVERSDTHRLQQSSWVSRRLNPSYGLPSRFAVRARTNACRGCDKTTRRANHPKACPALVAKNIPLNASAQISALAPPVSPDERGGSRSSRTLR